MKHWMWLAVPALAAMASFTAVEVGRSQEEKGSRLPDGKSQQEEILKADYEKTLKDAAELADLAQQLKKDLEKDDRHVLSISSLKKTEEIEKLARRIRTLLRRF